MALFDGNVGALRAQRPELVRRAPSRRARGVGDLEEPRRAREASSYLFTGRSTELKLVPRPSLQVALEFGRRPLRAVGRICIAAEHAGRFQRGGLGARINRKRRRRLRAVRASAKGAEL